MTKTEDNTEEDKRRKNIKLLTVIVFAHGFNFSELYSERPSSLANVEGKREFKLRANLCR